TFFGTINNTGNITINSTGNFTDAYFGGVTFTGGGRVYLSNADRIRGSGVFTNTDNIIQGETNNSGSFGTNEIGIVNQSAGLIDANVNGLVLNIDPNSTNGLTNAGTMRASNGGILLLNGNGGGDFNSSGTIAATSGGTLRFNGNVNSSGTVDVGNNTLTATGTYTQSAGTFRVAGGSVQSNNALNFQAGLVDAYGTISSAITNNANLRPALGGSGLQVTGNVSLLSASRLTFQLGGLTQGSQYGFLNVNGNVSLGGQLVVSFVNNFQNSVNSSNTFTLATSGSAFSGTLANVASGTRLTASNANGSFLVNYIGNTLTLSNYMSPAAAAQAVVLASSAPDPGPPSGAGATSTSQGDTAAAPSSPGAPLAGKDKVTVVSRDARGNRALPEAAAAIFHQKQMSIYVTDSNQLASLIEQEPELGKNRGSFRPAQRTSGSRAGRAVPPAPDRRPPARVEQASMRLRGPSLPPH
nr:hypothetical protein [Verrucomicrobiota bacterium]